MSIITINKGNGKKSYKHLYFHVFTFLYICYICGVHEFICILGYLKSMVEWYTLII